MNKLEGYKTIAFVVITFLLGIANLFGFGEWEMPAQFAQYSDVFFSLVVPAIFGILRLVTKSEVPFLRKQG